MGRVGLAGTGALVLLAPLVVMAPAASADSGSFHQPAGISIEDRNFNVANTSGVVIAASGKAAPYPSTVTVSGVQGTIRDLNLELLLNHPYPHGVDVLLVGPAPENRQAIIFSDVGADQPTPTPVVDLTLDDQADAGLPTSSSVLTSGDYRPTNHGSGDPFDSPAPTTATTGSALSVFTGINPNGTWSLYVMGDGVPAGGQLTRWALDFDTTNTSKPYPSTIQVSGLTKGVSDIDVTLHGFSHQRPSDVDVMLVGPQGQRSVLMSNAGAGGGPAGGGTLRFDDEAPSALPRTSGAGDLFPAGSFRPGDYGSYDDAFPPPAPDRVGSAPNLTTFDGTNPNGTWQLFVLDTAFGQQGSFSGWTLDVTTATAPAPPVITAPANGSLDNDGVLDFAGTAAPSSTVRLLDNGVLVGIANPTSSGSWSAFVGGAAAGWHSYVATATDSFGNVSAPSATVSVLVDRVAPDGVVTIDGGAGRTSRTSVALGLGATDPEPSSGIAQMRFSNNAATWSAFEPFAPTKAWTLPGGDGTKTVYAQFRDHAGNVSGTASDTIVLDTDGSGGGSGGSGGSGSAGSADRTAPTVTSTKPSHRATGVKPKANVTAAFSEAVQAASVNRVTVRLIAPDGRTVKARVTYDPSRRTVVINPKANLARGTTYKVVITAVRDVAGNQLDQKPKAGIQPKRWKFTTR